eukprot:499157_1
MTRESCAEYMETLRTEMSQCGNFKCTNCNQQMPYHKKRSKKGYSKCKKGCSFEENIPEESNKDKIYALYNSYRAAKIHHRFVVKTPKEKEEQKQKDQKRRQKFVDNNPDYHRDYQTLYREENSKPQDVASKVKIVEICFITYIVVWLFQFVNWGTLLLKYFQVQYTERCGIVNNAEKLQRPYFEQIWDLAIGWKDTINTVGCDEYGHGDRIRKDVRKCFSSLLLFDSDKFLGLNKYDKYKIIKYNPQNKNNVNDPDEFYQKGLFSSLYQERRQSGVRCINGKTMLRHDGILYDYNKTYYQSDKLLASISDVCQLIQDDIAKEIQKNDLGTMYDKEIVFLAANKKLVETFINDFKILCEAYPGVASIKVFHTNDVVRLYFSCSNQYEIAIQQSLQTYEIPDPKIISKLIHTFSYDERETTIRLKTSADFNEQLLSAATFKHLEDKNILVWDLNSSYYRRCKEPNGFNKCQIDKLAAWSKDAKGYWDIEIAKWRERVDHRTEIVPDNDDNNNNKNKNETGKKK